MTPLDTLKAGVKTAVVTFLAGLLTIVTGLLGELIDFVGADRDPIDWAWTTSLLVTLASALAVGILNALLRYVQVAGVPFVGWLVSKFLGDVPAYPEKNQRKVIDATPADVTAPPAAVHDGPAVDEIAVGLRQGLQAYIDDYGWTGVKRALELLEPNG